MRLFHAPFLFRDKMMTDKSNSKDEKPTIFVSHSSQDIMIARAVRNLLEDRDHEVILFHLKHLEQIEDEEKRDAEIKRILDEEVNARDWLILIDTENSRGSEWVEFEIERAREYKKDIYKISGDRFKGYSRYQTEEILQPCIRSFSQSLRVFLSFDYKHKQKNIADAIQGALNDKGIECFTGHRTSKDKDIFLEINERMGTVMEESGIFILIVTKETVKSQSYERFLANRYRDNMRRIAFIVDDISENDLGQTIREMGDKLYVHDSPIELAIQELLNKLNDIRYSSFEENCGGEVIEGS
jgi:phosphopantetheine adenylyltransferase